MTDLCQVCGVETTVDEYVIWRDREGVTRFEFLCDRCDSWGCEHLVDPPTGEETND